MARSTLYPLLVVTCLGVVCARAAAQSGGDLATPAGAEAPNMVKLNFPEQLPLALLVNYVAKRHNINFIHKGDVLGMKKVTLKARHRIPSDELLPLLKSALNMHSLVIVPTDVAGVMRIEKGGDLHKTAVWPELDDANRVDGQGVTSAVTRVFRIEHAQVTRADEVVKRYLSASQASTYPIEEQDLLIVTDFTENMPRIADVLALIDRPGRAVLVEQVPIEHLKAADVKDRVDELVQAKAKAGTGKPLSSTMTVLADERTNSLTVVGTAESVEQTLALARTVDQPLGQTTKIYKFTYVTPERVDTLTRSLIGELKADRLYDSAIDETGNLLLATATPQIHEQIQSLRESIDVPEAEVQSPIRFYKLENADAAEVLATLSRIQQSQGDVSNVQLPEETPSADAPSRAGAAADPAGGAADAQAATGQPRVVRAGPTEDQVNRGGDAPTGGSDLFQGPSAVDLPEARVMADTSTNSIIVVAPPQIQRVYEKLIRELDVRRPQVLIEATVVILDTSDNFSLGVELHSDEDVADGTLLTFSQFGLSVGDPNTGNISISPGVGFNGALLGTDIAQVIIRALERDARTRIVSRPSVLVNDNATGTLASESEEPFTTTSQVAGAPSQTTFGGFATAGTNISITPQISEGDYLVLDYAINVSSFSGPGGNGVPPPRATDEVSSKVTIPDGSTIIVGGLTRENLTESVDRVPLLGRIPVLEYLFSDRSTDENRTTLFVFIHATILRDDKFRDLRYLSGDAAARADLAQEHPTSEPLDIN